MAEVLVLVDHVDGEVRKPTSSCSPSPSGSASRPRSFIGAGDKADAAVGP